MYPNMMEHPQTIDFTCIKCPKIFTVTHVKKHSCTPQTVINKCIDCNYLNCITIPPSIKYCSNISCQECYACKPMLLHSCLGYRPGYNQREEYEIIYGKRNDLSEGPIEICIAKSDKLKSRPKFSIFNPPLQTPSSEGSTTIRIHEPPSERFGNCKYRYSDLEQLQQQLASLYPIIRALSNNSAWQNLHNLFYDHQPRHYQSESNLDQHHAAPMGNCDFSSPSSYQNQMNNNQHRYINQHHYDSPNYQHPNYDHRSSSSYNVFDSLDNQYKEKTIEPSSIEL
ncbi:hypothetical protein BJ944DRAFT_251751, partial [Cunninghamella echinulata]